MCVLESCSKPPKLPSVCQSVVSARLAAVFPHAMPIQVLSTGLVILRDPLFFIVEIRVIRVFFRAIKFYR